MSDTTSFPETEPPRRAVRANMTIAVAAGISIGVMLAAGLIWITHQSPAPVKVQEQRIGLDSGEFKEKFPQDYALPKGSYEVPGVVTPPVTAMPQQQAPAARRAQVPAALPREAVGPSGPLSPIFAPTRGDPAAERFTQEPAPTTGTAYPAGGGESDKLDDADQTDKGQWIARLGAGSRGKERVSDPMLAAMPHQIQAGTILHAATLTTIDSDLPGDAVAVITSDVYDSADGDELLIPAGSKLFGHYSSQLSFGQTRIQLAWTRILFRNGTSQTIGAMIGTDAGGAAGTPGEVDHHSLGMAGAIGLSALMSVISQAGQIAQPLFGGGTDGGQTNVGIVGLQGAGQSTANVGQQMAQNQLNLPNTIRVPQGTQVAVLVSKDMSLLPHNNEE